MSSSSENTKLGKAQACEQKKSTQENFTTAASACPARIHMASFPEGISPSHCVLATLIRANGDYEHSRDTTVGNKHSSPHDFVNAYVYACINTQKHTIRQITSCMFIIQDE